MEKKTLTEAAPRRIAAAAAASAVGIGKKWRRVFRRAEMSVQFYLPFFIQSFLSLIRRTAGYILSRRKPCCLMTKNEREIDVVFTTTIQPASPLHNTHWSGIENSNLKYICSNMSELKEKCVFLNPKLLCWCSDLGKSTKSVRTVWKTTQMPSYVNLPNLNLIINIQVISTNRKKSSGTVWNTQFYDKGIYTSYKYTVHCAALAIYVYSFLNSDLCGIITVLLASLLASVPGGCTMLYYKTIQEPWDQRTYNLHHSRKVPTSFVCLTCQAQKIP